MDVNQAHLQIALNQLDSSQHSEAKILGSSTSPAKKVTLALLSVYLEWPGLCDRLYKSWCVQRFKYQVALPAGVVDLLYVPEPSTVTQNSVP